jgi:hypothetical protein
MLDTSKKILLDQTYLFRGITNLFKADRELTEDEVVVELKSIMGLQVLRQYVSTEMASLSNADDSNVAKVIRMLNNAFTSDYWLNENAPQELKLLKKKFPENEFLKSLSSKPALRETKTNKEKALDEKLIEENNDVNNQHKCHDDFGRKAPFAKRMDDPGLDIHQDHGCQHAANQAKPLQSVCYAGDVRREW